MDTPASRTTYPSDLTEDQWRQIAPLLPDEKPHGRHRVTSLREVVNAIHYRDQMGCSWRMLPHDFPAWGTVYSYYRRWNRDATLSELRNILKRQTAIPPAAPSKSAPQSADFSNSPWPPVL